MHTLFDLSGKTAIVTRCATDIGRQMTEALAEAGADIIGIDRCPMVEVEAAVKRYGRSFDGIEADLTEPALIPGLVRSIASTHGKIDILVCYSNEQDSGEEPENISWEEYLRIVDANQNAVVRLSTLVYDQMLRQGTGGKIVIVSSVLAERTASNTLAYTVTKNAVIGLMRTLSIAGAQHSIWVNAIAPGIMETAAIRALPDDVAAQLESILERTGLGAMRMTLGKPGNLRGVTVFLSSKASDYIVGEVFRIDGGFTSRI